jgi:prepilin-type N-terminal cleavage/methylation domain-containing protein
MNKQKGFTLIELLIVVAIIAILAAIAVPNFLEAQVRSKVSRQLSNMRTVTTALETYYVDNNKLPLTTYNVNPVTRPGGGNWDLTERWKFWPGFEGTAGGLTTPIAYLSSADAMIDIFRLPHNYTLPLANQIMWLPTEFYNSQKYSFLTGNPYDPNSTFSKQSRRYGTWTMRSAGPDTYYQNLPGRRGDYDDGGWGQASYDPTNGSVSAGDIYRSQKRPDEDHI